MSIFDVDKHIESFDDSLKYVAPWEYLKSVADPDWQTGEPGLHMQTSFVHYEEYERDWMEKNGVEYMPIEIVPFLSLIVPPLKEFREWIEMKELKDVVVISKESINENKVPFDLNGIKIRSRQAMRGKAQPLYDQCGMSFEEYKKNPK